MITEEMKNAPRKEKRIFYYVLGAIAFTVLIIFICFRFKDFSSIFQTISNAVMPFLCGMIVAYILNAFVNLFEKVIFAPLNRRFAQGKIWNKIQRPITLVLSYLIVFLVIGLIFFFIIPELIKSGELFADTASKTVPVYLNQFSAWLNDTATRFGMDVDVKSMQANFLGNFNWGAILENATKFTSDILSGIVSATVNVASGVFTVIMSFIFSVYFLGGKEKHIKTFKRLLYAFTSRRMANRISMFLTVSNNVFSCYVRGQLTECVILGILCYIGMNIIGLEYALLISTILTLSALVPILGAYVGAGLGAVILLMVKPIDALWFLIFLVVLQQFEGNVIYPKVVGSSIGLPGIWTLTAVVIFGSLFGIPGIIIGTPTAAVAYKLLSYKTTHKLAAKGVTEEVLGGSEVLELYGDIVKPDLHEDDEHMEHRESGRVAGALQSIKDKMGIGKKGKH